MIAVQVLVEILLRVEHFLAFLRVWYTHLRAPGMAASPRRFCFVDKRAPERFGGRDVGMDVLLVSFPVVFTTERFDAWMLGATIGPSVAFEVFPVGWSVYIRLVIHGKIGETATNRGGEDVSVVCMGGAHYFNSEWFLLILKQ